MRDPQARRERGTEREGIYLFCFARCSGLPPIEGEGLDDRFPILQWAYQELVAVVSKACLDDFCGHSGDTHLQDLGWIGPRACRHEAVIEHVMNHSPVLPARFGTLFSSLSSLDELLKRHYQTISRFLDEVENREEWALKGLLDKARARAQILSELYSRKEPASPRPGAHPPAQQISGQNVEDLAASPGRHYFRGKTLGLRAEAELNGWLKAVCQELGDDLSAQALEVRKRRTQQSDLNDMDVILNWAFLIQRSSLPSLRARVDRANADCEPRGLVFEVSGPWPPYSFCPAIAPESEA